MICITKTPGNVSLQSRNFPVMWLHEQSGAFHSANLVIEIKTRSDLMSFVFDLVWVAQLLSYIPVLFFIFSHYDAFIRVVQPSCQSCFFFVLCTFLTLEVTKKKTYYVLSLCFQHCYSSVFHELLSDWNDDPEGSFFVVEKLQILSEMKSSWIRNN